jgi:hypothetical protein
VERYFVGTVPFAACPVATCSLELSVFHCPFQLVETEKPQSVLTIVLYYYGIDLITAPHVRACARTSRGLKELV